MVSIELHGPRQQRHDLQSIRSKDLAPNGLTQQTRALHGFAAQHSNVRARCGGDDLLDPGEEGRVVGNEGFLGHLSYAPNQREKRAST